MSGRLDLAEAALKAGRAAEAVEHLIAAVSEDPARTVQVYRVLLIQLYRLGRFAEGETWSAKAAERFPRDLDIWNIRGVFLRQLGRHPEALAALETASKIDPKHDSPISNRANVFLDMRDGAKAEALFLKLLRKQPRNAELQRLLGKALVLQNKTDQALVRFRQAVAIQKTLTDGWLDLSALLSDLGRTGEAEEAVDRGLAVAPGHPKLTEAKLVILRRAGQAERAQTLVEAVLAEAPDTAWAHHQLAAAIGDVDRERANVHHRRAIELAPTERDYLLALIESLERTRSGDEGANVEEAVRLARTAMAMGTENLSPPARKVLYEVFIRVCDYEQMDRLGDLRSLGTAWAESDRHTALFKLLPQVKTLDDRLDLLAIHRRWGELAEKRAASAPIRRPPPRAPGRKVRVGFMSSDLRNHPVGYFAAPLFAHADHERFEIFAYSYYTGAEDPVQAQITRCCDAFRWRPQISDRDAAQMIADDDLDMLVELGGSTHMNKLQVMAYRPAPRSASWVGYPFSAGLKTIDYLAVDPYVAPADPRLMLEEPLLIGQAWYALSEHAFREQPSVNPEPPYARKGWITFGTANNTYKYTPELIAAWAAAMRQVPDSRFLFVRPEGGCESFRVNILAHFARHGIEGGRIQFAPVRGRHLPFYNEMDISLDTFPQTGGTTTSESVWMGVPVVTLVGPALFERLSYSVLMNLGLDDLCARSVEGYVEAAVRLAQDRPRIAELRRTLRPHIVAGPMRDGARFARDFYDAIERAVRGQAGVEASSPRLATSS